MKGSIEQTQAMNGLEEVSRVLARYSAVETLLLKNGSEDYDINFEAAVVQLYVEIIKFQACSTCHFARNTAGRMFKNIVASND